MIPEKVVAELREYGNTSVLIQLPEGLKAKAVEIADELRENGFEPAVSGDVCFGACDLKFLKNATTLHIGHSKMVDAENVVYWEYSYGQDLIPATEKALPFLGKRVGLFTTVQHLQSIERVREFLESKGKIVLTAKGRVTCEYQVLGCDAAGAVAVKGDVDSFLYIGSGRFHAIAIAFYTKKHVVAADPFSLEVEEIAPGIWEKERALRQTKAMGAQSVGIVVSTKPGQTDWAAAGELAKRVSKAGKRPTVICMDNITPDLLLPYKVDAFIITACPRIVVDDWKSYKKPVLLPDEANFLLVP